MRTEIPYYLQQMILENEQAENTKKELQNKFNQMNQKYEEEIDRVLPEKSKK